MKIECTPQELKEIFTCKVNIGIDDISKKEIMSSTIKGLNEATIKTANEYSMKPGECAFNS